MLFSELKTTITVYKKKQTRPVVKIKSHIIKLWNSTIHSITWVAESCGEVCQASAASQKEKEKKKLEKINYASAIKANRSIKTEIDISRNKK